MTVTLIYGGKSGEHEVSLVSAAAIARGLSKNYSLNLIAITKKGKWYLQPASELERILSDLKAHFEIIEDESKVVSVLPAAGKSAFVADGKALETDCVFPALHGSFGEDGNIQGLFEMAEVPYVGCTTMSSALTMDKEKTKQVWQAAGLPVVPYVCMPRSVMMDSVVYDAFLDETEKELGYPMFVKPSSAGSSNGAAKAKSRKELAFALMEAFQWDDKVLIEKSIDGAREIECSVTGNSVSGDPNNEVEDVVAYIPGEILPSHDFYDYDAKYNDENGAALQIPANLSEEGLEKIRKAAVAAYKVLDCSGLSRVDFFISKEDGQVFLNEINTLPGFTPISMFPKMCEAAGLEFEALTKLLIDEALAKYESKSQLIRSR
ncbi:MAG: D-alanine--D-alanine ligase [Treponema sp.]|nr:D-alanine--D-alanine ligase [Treponema sp.]